MGDRRDGRPSDALPQDRRHRRPRAASSSPSCPRPTTRCGCAATGSSTRRRCPPRSSARGRRASPSRPRWPPRRRRRRPTTRPTTGCRSSSPPRTRRRLPGGRNQHAWMSDFKLGCELCHQMGSASARGMRGNRAGLDAGLKKAGSMDGAAMGLGRDALLDALADWGGRIAAGQVPEAPPRPEGHRAQHGHHPVGLGRPLHLRPRRDRHRQAQPAALPGREDLGRRPRQRPPAERQPGHPRGRRAARAHGRRLHHAVGRPGAERLPVARRPRPGRLDPAPGRLPEPGEPAQPDDGRHGQGLDDHPDPGRAARGLPRVLPRRPRDRREQPPPAARLLRHQQRRVPAHRHLLRHPPPAVRRGGQAVDERRRLRARLVRPGQVRPGAARDARARRRAGRR